MVEDVCHLYGACQNNFLPLLLPPQVQIEEDLLTGGICPSWISLQKLFLWWGLPTASFLCLLMLLLVLDFLPKPLQTSTWPLCCQILCILGSQEWNEDFLNLSLNIESLKSWVLTLRLLSILEDNSLDIETGIEILKSRIRETKNLSTGGGVNQQESLN